MLQLFLPEKMEVRSNKTELKCVNPPRKYRPRVCVFNHRLELQGNKLGQHPQKQLNPKINHHNSASNFQNHHFSKMAHPLFKEKVDVRTPAQMRFLQPAFKQKKQKASFPLWLR